MKSILVLLAAATLITACSPSDEQYLALPTASPTNLHGIGPHEGDRPFIRDIWGIPVVLTEDFVPG